MVKFCQPLTPECEYACVLPRKPLPSERGLRDILASIDGKTRLFGYSTGEITIAQSLLAEGLAELGHAKLEGRIHFVPLRITPRGRDTLADLRADAARWRAWDLSRCASGLPEEPGVGECFLGWIATIPPCAGCEGPEQEVEFPSLAACNAAQVEINAKLRSDHRALYAAWRKAS